MPDTRLTNRSVKKCFHSLTELDNTQGTVQLHAATGDAHILLHPRPNRLDPNDPLRWSQRKKYVCFTSVCTFAFLTNYAIAGLSPAFYPLSLQFARSMTETSQLLLWPVLVLGLSNFLWVPMANYFGKRPIFVLTTCLLCLSYLWGALAQSFESLLWSSIVAAFAGSASEALAISIVNDLFFTHERANLMGWYVNAMCGGNTIGPLICGVVVTQSGWRVHKWHSFALAGVNFLFVVFYFPETRYDRSYLDIHMAPTSSLHSSPHILEAKQPVHRPPPPPVNPDLEKGTSNASLPAVHHPAYRTQPLEPIAKKTYLQDLSLWSGLPRYPNPVRLFLRPLPLIAYPAVILAFLGFAVSLAWVVAINILNSFVLQAPPYHWKPDMNGLINISGLVGNVLGAFIGGWVVDRYSNWRSKKNGGVFEPETRLHLLIVPALIVPGGCLLWGYGVARNLHWTALFVANGMVNVGLSAVPTMTMTYVSDVYLPVNADALTLVVGLKNVVAFGFLYAVVPWVQKTGYVQAFGAQAGIYVFVMVLAIPLVIWGQRIRHATATWRIIL